MYFPFQSFDCTIQYEDRTSLTTLQYVLLLVWVCIVPDLTFTLSLFVLAWVVFGYVTVAFIFLGCCRVGRLNSGFRALLILLKNC